MRIHFNTGKIPKQKYIKRPHICWAKEMQQQRKVCKKAFQLALWKEKLRVKGMQEKTEIALNRQKKTNKLHPMLYCFGLLLHIIYYILSSHFTWNTRSYQSTNSIRICALNINEQFERILHRYSIEIETSSQFMTVFFFFFFISYSIFIWPVSKCYSP